MVWELPITFHLLCITCMGQSKDICMRRARAIKRRAWKSQQIMLQEQRILFLVRRILSFIQIAQDARQVKYEVKKKEVETCMATAMVVDVIADEVLGDQAICNNISQIVYNFLQLLNQCTCHKSMALVTEKVLSHDRLQRVLQCPRTTLE